MSSDNRELVFQFLFVFSMSEDEGETVDSLDIKPPQAQISMQSGRSKRREGHERHHKRSERHRDERSHSHRQKHHRFNRIFGN